MSVAVSSIPPSARPLTVAQYQRLVACGVLTEDDDVELLEGWICSKMSRNPPHDVALHRAIEALRQRLSKRWMLRIQSAIETSDSMPEPDIAVVLAPIERYLEHHPRPDEVGIVIKVADTSLQEDRSTKARIYARAGIGTYWVVNVVSHQIEVYSEPTSKVLAPTYAAHRDYQSGQTVTLALPGTRRMAIRVHDIL